MNIIVAGMVIGMVFAGIGIIGIQQRIEQERLEDFFRMLQKWGELEQQELYRQSLQTA